MRLGFQQSMGLAVFLCASAVLAQDTLSLEQALALARERAPALAAEQAAVGVARGRLRTSQYWLPEEPEVSLELAPRASNGTTTTDTGIAIAQRFEILGQRGKRIRRDLLLLDATAADYAAFERDYLALVAGAYLQATAAEERLELARRAEAEGREADAAAASRHEAGDIALLDRNLAAIELARLERERWRMEGGVARAHAEVSYLLGRAPGDLRTSSSLVESLRSLERGLGADADRGAPALERSEVSAARARIEAQEAEASLLRAERAPDLVFSVGREREERTDRLTRFGVALSVPLFRKNRGEILAALAELDGARATLAVATRAAERDVAQAAARRRATEGALDAVRRRMTAPAEENLGLAASSYEAGKIGLLDLILVRRSALEALGALVDSRLEYGQALVEVRRAAGLLPPGLESAPATGR